MYMKYIYYYKGTSHQAYFFTLCYVYLYNSTNTPNKSKKKLENQKITDTLLQIVVRTLIHFVKLLV